VRAISWNLFWRTGAAVKDVAALIEREKPDVVLTQETTEAMDALTEAVGGNFHREPWPGRRHGLAAWSPHAFEPPRKLHLPVSRMPIRFPQRLAQLVRVGDITFANVHLSHGQLLNRRQLLHIAGTLEGPAAVMGDFNAVGPLLIPRFHDVGPREATHRAGGIVPIRLDRCLAHGVRCTAARALAWGKSDHRPILVELEVG
jgi:endonuclease/exonuclease/phosphatase (EEP) superfamily protein YafD